MPDRPLIIGVTGNIGSGKSTFCRYLEKSHLRVVYADKIAKAQLADAVIVAKLKARWGSEVISPSGRARRKAIARIIFNDPVERRFLNDLIHPKTLQAMQFIVETTRRRALVFEVPLLFEAGLQDCFDFIVLVHTAPELLIKRLRERDGTDIELLKKLIASQMPDDQKTGRVDLIITNDQDITKLEAAAKAFGGSIQEISKKKLKPFYLAG